MEAFKGVRQRRVYEQAGRRGDGDRMSKDIYVCFKQTMSIFGFLKIDTPAEV